MNLITGATGLVGAHLALKLLQNNETVVAIKRSSSDISKTKHVFSYYDANYEVLFNKIKWVEADILDIYSLIEALQDIKIVYHCAGLVSFDKSEEHLVHKINTEGTANVVNACLEKNIEVLCFVSSIAAIQNPDVTSNISESVFWKSSPNINQYAISKYNAEREVWRANEEGLHTIIVNPGIVLGPGFWNQSSGKLAQTCYKGLRFYTQGTSATVDVIDVVTSMIELVKQKKYGKRFILIEGNYSFRYILDSFHAEFGKSNSNIKAGVALLNVAYWLDFIKSKLTRQKQIITKETIIASLATNTYSNELIKSAINVNFIPLKQSIHHMAKAYLNDLKK